MKDLKSGTRKYLAAMAIAAAAFMVAAVAVSSTASARAVVPKATGSIAMSGPVQYASFDAFASNPVKGSISYTNFEYFVPGSGVWVPSAFNMGFAVDPSSSVAATYAMSVTSFNPTSPTSVTFSGTGDCGCGWISTFTGTISGSDLNLAMTEINAGNPSETYALTASGTIASDGSVTGTWTDNYGTGRTGTFVIADIGNEVLHYTASMSCVVVTGSDATFGFTIPAGFPGLSGLPIVVKVHDGGTPGTNGDTWAHGVATSACGGPTSNYPITSGNLVVH